MGGAAGYDFSIRCAFHFFWIFSAARLCLISPLFSMSQCQLNNQNTLPLCKAQFYYRYTKLNRMNSPHNHILLSINHFRRTLHAEGSKYPVVKQTALKSGFHLGTQQYSLYWTDHALSIRDIKQLPPRVRVNHLPEIVSLTRKNYLAMALNAMLRVCPKEYDFFPETFLLPMDHAMLLKKHTKQKYYIVKPENGCQGKGIYITSAVNKIERNVPHIVQRYISNPLLVQGLKFDLRIYVLVTCVQPLRVFMYREGMARFATEKFQPPSDDNVGDLFKHLTNYAINKEHAQFRVDNKDFSKGHKRLLSTLFSQSQLKQLHKKMSQIIIKSIIAVLPNLQNSLKLTKKQKNPNSCFQLLGFDILITDNMKLQLLEVNQNPSLLTDTPLDVVLKTQMLGSLFRIIGSTADEEQGSDVRQLRVKDRKQLENAGEFQRIYPGSSLEQTERYDDIIVKSQAVYLDRFGLNKSVHRDRDERKGSAPKISADMHVEWNRSTGFYSKEKLAKVYGQTKTRFSSQARRALYY